MDMGYERLGSTRAVTRWSSFQEYSIRVARLFNDPSSSSWIVIKRFREFDEMNNALKDYGFEFEFPKKKLFGNTDRIFMAQRQRELQVSGITVALWSILTLPE